MIKILIEHIRDVIFTNNYWFNIATHSIFTIISNHLYGMLYLIIVCEASLDNGTARKVRLEGDDGPRNNIFYPLTTNNQTLPAMSLVQTRTELDFHKH